MGLKKIIQRATFHWPFGDRQAVLGWSWWGFGVWGQLGTVPSCNSSVVVNVVRDAGSRGGKLPADRQRSRWAKGEAVRVGDRPRVGEASEPTSDGDGDGLRIGKRTRSKGA